VPPLPVAPPVPVIAHEGEAEEQPVFNRVAFPAAPPPFQPAAAPVFSPIVPDPVAKPADDAEVIQMPENYRPLPSSAPITPIAPEAEPGPEPIRFSAPVPRSVTPAVPAVPVTSGETRFITVAISEICGTWPEAVRNEINAQNLSGSWIGLPLGAVEGAIKTGKIAFPWKALRSWVKPPIPAAASTYDTTMLELPLKTIAPLFLSELKSNRTQRKFAVDEDIPDLFFNTQPVDANLPVVSATPVAAAPVAPPPPTPANPVPAFPAKVESARPADTNYFVWKEAAEESEDPAASLKKGTNTPSTAFLNRYATPNEIVSKTAALDGVDGALIALPDGLLVASKIPNNMNADTIAAFLPQIFGRVSQCTRELRLGELNNLNFTVGNIPWKIFRVGSIYFAAFGRPGVPLPTAQLVGLAAELDRKAK
jgi:predicted regulator of Ras-like GTPase activity (Roadblock/LC7/MglB family)